MSRTKIHKEKGKFNNGIKQDNISISLQKHYDRHNYDLDIFRALKKSKIEKQAEIDMQDEINSL